MGLGLFWVQYSRLIQGLPLIDCTSSSSFLFELRRARSKPYLLSPEYSPTSSLLLLFFVKENISNVITEITVWTNWSSFSSCRGDSHTMWHWESFYGRMINMCHTLAILSIRLVDQHFSLAPIWMWTCQHLKGITFKCNTTGTHSPTQHILSSDWKHIDPNLITIKRGGQHLSALGASLSWWRITRPPQLRWRSALLWHGSRSALVCCHSSVHRGEGAGAMQQQNRTEMHSSGPNGKRR